MNLNVGMIIEGLSYTEVMMVTEVISHTEVMRWWWSKIL